MASYAHHIHADVSYTHFYIRHTKLQGYTVTIFDAKLVVLLWVLWTVPVTMNMDITFVSLL